MEILQISRQNHIKCHFTRYCMYKSQANISSVAAEFWHASQVGSRQLAGGLGLLRAS